MARRPRRPTPRGDPQRRRDAADVAALREPRGARRHADLGTRGLPGARPLRDRVAAVVHVLADDARRRAAGRGRGRLARHRRRLRHASSIACSPTRARATPSGSSGTSGCASRRSPASPPSAPRSWRWRRARTWASPATTTTATWCRRCATSPSSTPGRGRGTFADLLTSDRSRSRTPPISPTSTACRAWSGSGDYPRFTDGSRSGLLQRAALLVSSLEQTNPFHRGAFVRRTSCATACRSRIRTACRPGSLDPPPPSTARPRASASRPRSTATACARAATTRSATSATCSSRTTRSAATARWRRCSTSRPARCWRAADRHERRSPQVIAGDSDRSAAPPS